MRRITVVLVMGFLLLAGACGQADDGAGGSPVVNTPTPVASPTSEPEPSPTVSPAADLNGTQWVLTALNGAPLGADTHVTLAFNNGQATGNGGCNDYGSPYTTTAGGGITLSEIVQTDMACLNPAGIMDTEVAYLSALSDVASYVVTQDELTLSNLDLLPTLVFKRAEHAALSDTSWTLTALDGAAPIKGTHPTIAFTDDQVSGSTGCNQFSGSYTASEDGTLKITDLQSTLIFCAEPEGIGEQEQAFLNALTDTATYRTDAGKHTLEFSTTNGQTRLVFTLDGEPTGTGPLNGTAWVLERINGAAWTGACPVTLSLESSQFDGEVECAGYAGFIDTPTDGEHLALRTDVDVPVTPTTDRDRYMAALANVSQFRQESDTLEFQDAQGNVVLSYRRAAADVEGLTNTVWTLTELNGHAPLADSEVTLEISAFRLGGNAGCNSYGSTFVFSAPGAISIPGGAITAMACLEPAGVMEQESEFMTALANDVVAYALTETNLTFQNAAGDTILVFK